MREVAIALVSSIIGGCSACVILCLVFMSGRWRD
jgi:hypothetical protein|nr:MAG TPA: hypothetical protein [Caudoviricetes sp.]